MFKWNVTENFSLKVLKIAVLINGFYCILIQTNKEQKCSIFPSAYHQFTLVENRTIFHSGLAKNGKKYLTSLHVPHFHKTAIKKLPKFMITSFLDTFFKHRSFFGPVKDYMGHFRLPWLLLIYFRFE